MICACGQHCGCVRDVVHAALQAALAFAEVLRCYGRLTELDLSLNFLHSDGVRSIAAAVGASSTLLRLQLNGCYMKSDGATAVGNCSHCSSSISGYSLDYVCAFFPMGCERSCVVCDTCGFVVCLYGCSRCAANESVPDVLGHCGQLH